MKPNPRIILGVALIITAIPLLFYFYKFHEELSSNADDWEAFGSFASFAIGLANLFIFIILSFAVYQYTKANDNPILVGTINDEGDKEVWQIKNIGNGPALNILVSWKTERNQSWSQPVKAYSLGKDDDVLLDWINSGPDVIGVLYNNLHGDQFLLFVGNDVSEIRLYKKNFRHIDINGITYDKEYFEPIARIPPKRITQARNQKGGSSTTTGETTLKPVSPAAQENTSKGEVKKQGDND